ncbi:hypothetical protein [Mesorhizobium caraganae]|uniref:hypothetical protein n=1 Tax=Mesorhizobium caraganae TaxID=483206 RepID=UPI00177DC3A4|nr:hypothetical protein [Mesorhizobium caraganae]
MPESPGRRDRQHRPCIATGDEADYGKNAAAIEFGSGLFAAVFVLVYFFGMTVQGFLISFVVFLAGLFVFNLFFPDDRPKGKG